MKITKTRLKQIIKEELKRQIYSPFSRRDRYENITDPRMKSILNAIDELQYHIKYTIVEEFQFPCTGKMVKKLIGTGQATVYCRSIRNGNGYTPCR